MQIFTLVLGPLSTNCYLVADEDGACAVVDPANQSKEILAFAEEKGLHIQAILLTHGHFDHIGGLKGVHEAVDCPVWLHEEDLILPRRLTKGNLFCTKHYNEGDTVVVGKLRFQVVHTPGHTPGSVCLACENVLFTGDTLFAGGVGRTDFEGSSPRSMRESLARLAAMEGEYRVLPGHGEDSTLQREQLTNPYLRKKS